MSYSLFVFFILVFIFNHGYLFFSYVVPSLWSFHFFIANSSDCIVLFVLCILGGVLKCVEMYLIPLLIPQ